MTFQEMLKWRKERQYRFEKLVREFDDDSLLAAGRAGRWYDRTELKLWQCDVIRNELEARRDGRALPPTGNLPPLTVTIRGA